jgi:hypothetical protein
LSSHPKVFQKLNNTNITGKGRGGRRTALSKTKKQGERKRGRGLLATFFNRLWYTIINCTQKSFFFSILKLSSTPTELFKKSSGGGWSRSLLPWSMDPRPSLLFSHTKIIISMGGVWVEKRKRRAFCEEAFSCPFPTSPVGIF